MGSCCIQTVSGEYYLTLSIVAIYDRGQLQYRRQRWLRGGDWNGSESGDWQVVTISDTLIYRWIFGVILYSSDGIYQNISKVTMMWRNNFCQICKSLKFDVIKLIQIIKCDMEGGKHCVDCGRSWASRNSFKKHKRRGCKVRHI